MDNTERLTRGEYLVGVSFNPGKNPQVDELKRKAADFIDAIERVHIEGGFKSKAQENEVGRCKALAITHAETAAMFCVKAATKPV